MIGKNRQVLESEEKPSGNVHVYRHAHTRLNASEMNQNELEIQTPQLKETRNLPPGAPLSFAPFFTEFPLASAWYN